MKRGYLVPLLATLFAAACGSGGSASEERDAVEAKSVTSSLALKDGAKAAIERAYTGGGATGNTLHKGWICQAGLTDCRLVATVSTHDGPPPIWRIAPFGLELVLGQEDTVWGFSNFSYLPGSGNRSIKIRLVERSL